MERRVAIRPETVAVCVAASAPAAAAVSTGFPVAVSA